MKVSTMYFLCNMFGWFTKSTMDQHDRLFQMLDDGDSLDAVVALIWTYSDGVSRQEIKAWLLKFGFRNEGVA